MTAIKVDELATVTALITSQVDWLLVQPGDGGDPDLPWSCAAVIGAQAAGADPTAPWRGAVRQSMARQYDAAPPVATPAAFVLQWYLEVPATIAAYTATLGPWLADVSPAALSFDLAPARHYPERIQLRRVHPLDPDVDRDSRLGAARTAYEHHAIAFAEAYDPGPRLGPQQRQGMVRDVWSMSVARAAGSLAPRRESCCFIYALPGARACAGCPRVG
jgi:FhuF 2Fe-2S C-terminal domain